MGRPVGIVQGVVFDACLGGFELEILGLGLGLGAHQRFGKLGIRGGVDIDPQDAGADP